LEWVIAAEKLLSAALEVGEGCKLVAIVLRTVPNGQALYRGLPPRVFYAA
jgi:hypothetical protein